MRGALIRRRGRADGFFDFSFFALAQEELHSECGSKDYLLLHHKAGLQRKSQ
jgi:hypothetical protein